MLVPDQLLDVFLLEKSDICDIEENKLVVVVLLGKFDHFFKEDVGYSLSPMI